MSTAKSILVIDVEATCWEDKPPNKFPQNRNEIIEIGLTRIDIKQQDIVETRSILVKPPTTQINEFCTKLTTLTPAMVEKHGVSFKQAINILDEEYKASRNIFASWGDYDRKSFEKNCAWNNVNYPFGNLHLNVKALFNAHFGHGGNMAVCYEEVFGRKPEGTHHRGDDDSKNIAKILLELMWGTLEWER
jgi:inhibitor of KinA sporulation pathway (predicted exonuclease)